MGKDVTAAQADGRILLATHWASLVVFIILVPALVILWGMPDRTADAWAWTIKPDLTPIFLGAGYGAGAYFFLRTFLSRRWNPSAAGVFGAAFFAALVFYGWVGVYIVSPFVVMGLWVLNRRTDSGEPAPGEPIVSEAVRLVARVVGIGALAAGAVCLTSPETMIDIWGWELTPLTARVIGCFTAQVGTGALWLSTDRRWSSWAAHRGGLLHRHGALREWGDFDTGRPATWL